MLEWSISSYNVRIVTYDGDGVFGDAYHRHDFGISLYFVGLKMMLVLASKESSMQRFFEWEKLKTAQLNRITTAGLECMLRSWKRPLGPIPPLYLLPLLPRHPQSRTHPSACPTPDDLPTQTILFNLILLGWLV